MKIEREIIDILKNKTKIKMSRPYFINLPKKVLENPEIKSRIEKNNIDIYNGCIYPKRIWRWMLDFNDWLNRLHKNDWKNYTDRQLVDKYISELNCNSVMENHISKYIKMNHNASLQFLSAGGKGGFTYYIYVNEDYTKCYFFTMNRYKHKKACEDFFGAKAFFINIYEIPYKAIDMLRYQDDYEFEIWQKPTGIKVKVIDRNK